MNIREEFMCSLHDFTAIILSLTARYVESTVQDVETKNNSVNLTAYSYTVIKRRTFAVEFNCEIYCI